MAMGPPSIIQRTAKPMPITAAAPNASWRQMTSIDRRSRWARVMRRRGGVGSIVQVLARAAPNVEVSLVAEPMQPRAGVHAVE